jgi:hypothetical protein
MSDESCGCGCSTKVTDETTDDCACGCECCGEKESKEGAVA